MDLNQILAYNDRLMGLMKEADTIHLRDAYSTSLIDNTLLELTLTEYEGLLVTKLDNFIIDVKAAFEFGSNKNLSLTVIDALIASNRETREHYVSLFASGTMDFIDASKLPDRYSLQAEGIIIDQYNNLVFDEDVILRYAKEVYLPYMEIFNKLVDVMYLTFLDIKDAIEAGSYLKTIDAAAAYEDLSKLQVDGTQNFIIDYKKITALYAICTEESMFANNFSITGFLDCFDLSKTTSVYPSFERGSQSKFCYLLSKIPYINNQTAKMRFGIKNYKSQKARVLSGGKLLNTYTSKIDKVVNS